MDVRLACKSYCLVLFLYLFVFLFSSVSFLFVCLFVVFLSPLLLFIFLFLYDLNLYNCKIDFTYLFADLFFFSLSLKCWINGKLSQISKRLKERNHKDVVMWTFGLEHQSALRHLGCWIDVYWRAVGQNRKHPKLIGKWNHSEIKEVNANLDNELQYFSNLTHGEEEGLWEMKTPCDLETKLCAAVGQQHMCMSMCARACACQLGFNWQED